MFVNPEQNINLLSLREGMKVADFGASTGFYSKACSKRVGHTGKVYAVEVNKNMVKKLEHDIKEWGITNIECIWGDIEKPHGTKIANNSMDRVIIANVLFQVEDKLGLIDEAKRVLNKNGKILVVDSHISLAPNTYAKHYVINKDRAKELFKSRGFKVEEETLIGEHQYGIIFTHE